MEPFHITATGHSLNYLPEYIASRHNFFTEQNLRVSVSVPKPWDLVLDDLKASRADAALGGIWVPSMYRGRETSYTVFAQVANKCPLAVIGRRRRNRSTSSSSGDFKVAGMKGSTVLMKSGNGASVGLFMKMLLREHGVDPATVHFVQDLDGIMLGKLFAGGMGDYFLTDNVSARVMARKDERVEVVMEMASDGGEIPWSVYYCETEGIDAQVLDRERRFCVALEKGIRWVMERDAEEYKEELAELFPAAPIDILVDLANVYRRNQMWSSCSVARYGYERWQKGIADGRLTDKPFAYETMVDDGPAQAALKIGHVQKEKIDSVGKAASVEINATEIKVAS